MFKEITVSVPFDVVLNHKNEIVKIMTHSLEPRKRANYLSNDCLPHIFKWVYAEIKEGLVDTEIALH